jgi:aminoglycoside phosphotransferase family enzyme
LELELEGRLAKADASHAAELEDLKADIQKKLSEAEKEKETLRKSMADLHEQEEKIWKEKIQPLDKRFRDQIAQREEELGELEESIHEMHEEAMLSKFSLQAEKEYEEHENILNTARLEAGQARDAHEKLKLAAGLATAIATGGTFLRILQDWR